MGRVDRRTVVWKFPVPIGGRAEPREVRMPARAEIVRVGQQADQPVVWALCDPDATETETRRLLALPTGSATSHRVAYLGTTEIHNGAIVVHVFEAVE